MSAEATTPPLGRATVLRRAGLAVLTLLLIAAGVVFLVEGASARTSGPLANRALVDSGRTNEVITQVSTGLNAVLSYDYSKPQVAQQAAATWLAGDAPAQYRTLFAQLQKLAPGQHLILVAKVVSAGVTDLRGDTAQLLVFLDQESTRATDSQSSVAAAQVQIQAQKMGATWKITELKPL